MDLKEMKDNWNDMTTDQSSLSKEQLLNITQSKYSRNISKIFIPEIVFTLMYLFLLLLFLAFNNVLETTTLKGLAYLAIAILIALPILNLTSTYRFYQTGKLMTSYKETLSTFKSQCQQFINLRKLTIALNAVLLLLCIILIPKIYTENLSSSTIIITFIILAMIALFISTKIWKYYKKQITHNEALILSLEEPPTTPKINK